MVYVDDDPLVPAHARALLVGADRGRTRFVGSDLRETGTVVATARETLDLDRPVGLTLLGTMGHLGDLDEAPGIVRTSMDALAPGGFLAVCDGVLDDAEAVADERALGTLRRWQESVTQPYHMRSVEEFGRFFDGFALVDPGIVSVTRWRPEPVEVGAVHDIPRYSGLARKA